MYDPESRLLQYYNDNFLLQQVHNYSLKDLEDQYPFEREILVSLLSQHIKKQAS